MAKKPKDPEHLHGHRVVTGPELRATLLAQTTSEDHKFRRRLGHSIVLALLLGVIAGGVVIALAVINGQIRMPAAVESGERVTICPKTVFDYPPNDQVNVNVFNATAKPGLARTVADQLQARGYKVGEVGNQGTGYSGVAMVVSGEAGQAGAFNIQRNLAGTDYFQDAREDASVDLIVTEDFKELVPQELVDQTPGQLSCPRESKRISDTLQGPVKPTGN